MQAVPYNEKKPESEKVRAEEMGENEGVGIEAEDETDPEPLDLLKFEVRIFFSTTFF